MSRTGMAGFFSVMLAISVIIGAYSILILPSVQEFSEADLHAPNQYIAQSIPSVPASADGDPRDRPDITVMIYVGQIFEDYGGAIKILVTNNDSRPLFLEEVSFEWVGTALNSQIIVNSRIEPNEICEIKALAVDGPLSDGNNEYQLKMRVLQLRNNQWYQMVSGGDVWLSFTEQVIEVQALAEESDNPIDSNVRTYYSRVNDLVDLSSENVAMATENATQGMTGGYNMGKVCAIFDFLVAEVNYTEDPGRDNWYSPDQTLETLKGDCEDYAMLLSAMVSDAGGTCRIYLTKDHAFATVYVGNTTAELDSAMADVQEYYRTQVPIHAFEDDTGYWMVADPLGSFYMGGLAVGQEPIDGTQGNWDTTFPDSANLYSIDVTGKDMTPPLYLDPLLWAGMMLVFGVLTLAFIISVGAEKPIKTMCHICAGEITEDIYICPTCQTSYHRPCAFSRTNCMTCQAPIRFPPPPPPSGPNFPTD
ncbi:MAG: RING finger protein [Thermoplasmata archaeon]|nr:RING finger protein [Thermoplasmata archaeon]